MPFILSAHDFEADGLFYNIVSAKDKTCELGNKTGSALTTPTEQWCFNSIAIPETVEYNGITFSVIGIGKEAFYFQAGLTSVEMHSNIKYIGASAFAGCRNLSYIDIPNSVTEIGNVAFRYCFNLSYIKFPENLTKISSYILGNCENLKTIVLPNSVREISRWAFENCLSLEEITIGENLEFLEDNAFEGCPILKKIYYNTNNPKRVLTDKYSNQDASFPESYYLFTTLYVKDYNQDSPISVSPWCNFQHIENNDNAGCDEIEISNEFPSYYLSLQGVKSTKPHIGVNIVVFQNGMRIKKLFK